MAQYGQPGTQSQLADPLSYATSGTQHFVPGTRAILPAPSKGMLL